MPEFYLNTHTILKRASRMLVHATSVEKHGQAFLLCGPSGAGKSDLALRL